MPKISVIVPNYNHAPYLKQRIDSVLNQTYQDFELILLDDCSTDNSREVLSEYQIHSKVSYCVFNEQNSGTTFKQWEKGIGLAKGEYIWIGESDDWADSTFLETIMAALTENKTAGLAFTASQLVDSHGVVLYENSQHNTGELIVYNGSQFITEKLLTSNAIWNASMMIFKKSLYGTLKDLSFMDMRYCGDWFFYVQLCERTKVLEVRKTLNFYRTHEQNVSNEAKRSGKYFTEGFQVYTYISRLNKVIIPPKTISLWAKMYTKADYKYRFNADIRKSIMYLFFRYNPLLIIYVCYWKVRSLIKRLM